MCRKVYLALVVAMIGGTILSMTEVDAQSTVDDSASCESSTLDEAVDLIREGLKDVKNLLGAILQQNNASSISKKDLEVLKAACVSNSSTWMSQNTFVSINAFVTAWNLGSNKPTQLGWEYLLSIYCFYVAFLEQWSVDFARTHVTWLLSSALQLTSLPSLHKPTYCQVFLLSYSEQAVRLTESAKHECLLIEGQTTLEWVPLVTRGYFGHVTKMADTPFNSP